MVISCQPEEWLIEMRTHSPLATHCSYSGRKSALNPSLTTLALEGATLEWGVWAGVQAGWSRYATARLVYVLATPEEKEAERQREVEWTGNVLWWFHTPAGLTSVLSTPEEGGGMVEGGVESKCYK
jgi:hypothetical protein